jgi:demethylmenaquinone methyltransferase/2-methoxy-6-polyprenyl-1,4-benzoquinol methylase
MAAPENHKDMEAPSSSTTHLGYRQVPEADKGRLVHRHFEVIARKYDLMNTLLSFGYHHFWKWTAVRLMRLKKGDRVLDVCGGTGDLALLAAKVVGTKGRVVVCDFNRAMMLAGRPKVCCSSLAPRLSCVQGDAENLPCPDASFDAAMVGFGVRNLTHPDLGLKEMHRVLKPGGRLMILEFSTPVTPWFRRMYDFYSFHLMPRLGRLVVGAEAAYTYLPESIRMFAQPAELAGLMEQMGFTQVSFRRLTNGIAVVHLGVKI